MSRLICATSTLLLAGVIVPAAHAQSPAPATNPPAATARPRVNAAPRRQAAQAPLSPAAANMARLRRRSIVQHYPYPYPSYYYTDRTAGYRNPGGVGRYREYYAPGDDLQPARDPVRVATFGNGGIPDRQEQLQAQQIGIARENAIQQHIDRYAMPAYGYGFGVGYFGGFY